MTTRDERCPTCGRWVNSIFAHLGEECETWIDHETLPPGWAPVRSEYPENSIFIFDFDGVLICQNEEKLYRLEEIEGERARLEVMADQFGIEAELYSTPYLRHLIFQERYRSEEMSAYEPIVTFAHSLLEPYFIMTARSGLAAIERLTQFVRWEGLTPQEVFCLGRGSKGDLLGKLLEQWPESTIVFFDDTEKHIDDACRLSHDRLRVVHVKHSTCNVAASQLRQDLLA